MRLRIFLKCSLFLSCKVIYNEQRPIVEVINFSFSSWLSKTNESNEKKDATDKNFNITRGPGHYEQKDPFILYKFDDLQSRNSNLKLVENLKKYLKRDSITIKKQGPTYLLLKFGCYRKFMKHESNQSSIQNITVSNLLNRLESLNFCTQAETKEYYETLTARH